MRKWIFAGLLVLFASLAMGPQMNTNARCSTGQDCSIGSNTASGITLDTSNGDFNVGGVTADTATMTATTTNTAVFQGADAASPASTTFDTTGAGAIVLGSADVTTLTLTNNGAMALGAAATTDSVTINSAGAITLEATGAINIGDASATSVIVTTDGLNGVVTIDGSVLAQVPAASVATGAIAINGITLATGTTTDYDIPDGACNAAADIGNWVTIVMEDASTVISITSDDASNIFNVHGLGALTAGDELDSVSHSLTEGLSITLTCLTSDNWWSTGGQTIHTDGTIAWADGGTAD